MKQFVQDITNNARDECSNINTNYLRDDCQICSVEWSDDEMYLLLIVVLILTYLYSLHPFLE